MADFQVMPAMMGGLGNWLVPFLAIASIFPIANHWSIRWWSWYWLDRIEYGMQGLWLVGVTDGDGTFTIDRLDDGKKWVLVFKISQKFTNGGLLYFIKEQLGVGHVTEASDGMWSFRIRDMELFQSVLFPIFDTYILRTVKYFDYLIMKEAYIILNSDLSRDEINSRMEELYLRLQNGPASDYMSPVWAGCTLTNVADYMHVISKAWLVGFWAAEGSFYITHKAGSRYTHGFGLTQKEDRHILEVIRLIFNSKSAVKDRGTFFSWDSTSKACCKDAANYFRGCFIGSSPRTASRFAIWAESLSYTGEALIEARDKLRMVYAMLSIGLLGGTNADDDANGRAPYSCGSADGWLKWFIGLKGYVDDFGRFDLKNSIPSGADKEHLSGTTGTRWVRYDLSWLR
ncbi:hypothetical protein HDV05_003434 [Chytridiales sp. JEL 0842]|nr:hypothetical protein HDV05_003434 [Chytridiales sp. JEL 0842]